MNFYVYDQHIYNRDLQEEETEEADEVETELKETSNESDFTFHNDSEASDCEIGTMTKYKNYKKSYTKVGIVTLFGKTENGNSIAIHVNGFMSAYFVKVPADVKYNIFVAHLRNSIMERCRSLKHKNAKLNLECVKYIDGYGFTNNEKIEFVKFSFSNFNTHRSILWALKDSKFKIAGKLYEIELYESKLEPILQFLHNRDLPSVGMVNVAKFVNMRAKLTNCKYEICAKYEDLVPGTGNMSQSGLSIMAFDIETAPLVSREMHGLAKLGDPIIAMPVSFYISGKYYNYVPILWNCETKWETFTVIPCKDETELLMTFIKLLRTGPPDMSDCATDVMISYNGNSYDWNYIRDRCIALDLWDELRFSGKIGKLSGKFAEPKMESKGFGKNEAYFMTYAGILNIDLLLHFKKENSTDLEDLKLATVSKAYLYVKDDSKKDVKIITATRELRDAVMNGAEISTPFLAKMVKSYGGLDSFKELTESNIVLIQKYLLESLNKKTSSEGEKYDLSYENMYKIAFYADKCIKESKLDDEKMFTDVGEIAKYSIQDCVLLHKLNWARNILNYGIAMANNSYIPWKMFYACATGKPIYSIFTKTSRSLCKLTKDLYPNKDAILLEFEEYLTENKEYQFDLSNLDSCGYTVTKYDQKLKKLKEKYYAFYIIAGGYVEEPVQGLHKNVATLDVKSEYPSIMLSYNLSHDALIIDERYNNIEGIDYRDYTWESKNGNQFTNRFVYGKIEDFTTLCVLKQLLENRKRFKAEGKKYKYGTSEYLQYDAAQQSAKILCNSTYGATVFSLGPLFMKPIGGCTTSKSRQYIHGCTDLVRELYPKSQIVYGDTDSFFVKFNFEGMTDAEGFAETWKASKDCEIEINKKFGSYLRNMEIELEKVFSIIYLFDKKKKYFGRKHLSNDIMVYETMSQGVKYKKRDSVNLQRFMGYTIQEYVLNDRANLIVNFMLETFRLVMEGKFDLTYFVKNIKYNPPYKNEKNNSALRVYSILSVLDAANLPKIGQKLQFTLCKFPECRTKKKSQLKKCDMVYPIDHINSNHIINYPEFMTYCLSDVMHIVKSLGGNAFTDIKKYIKECDKNL